MATPNVVPGLVGKFKSSNIGKGQQFAQKFWFSGTNWPEILEIGFFLVSGVGFSPKYRRQKFEENGQLEIVRLPSGNPFPSVFFLLKMI